MNEITIVRTLDIVTVELNTIHTQAERQALAAAIEMGRLLCEAKEMVSHGEWGDYLKNNTRLSSSSANSFMRVFREYGEEQSNLFGATAKSQTLGNLTFSKAVALLAIPETEREEFAEEVDAENLSTRELEKAIRERKAAEELKKDADKRAEDSRCAMQDALDRAAEATAESERIREEKKELERQLEELRDAEPADAPDEQTLDSIRAEAAATAKKEAEDALKVKIEKADAAKKKADEARKEAEDELKRRQQELEREQAENEKLRKNLAMANSGDAVAFRIHYQNAQTEINKMLEYIDKADDEQKVKFSAALSALCSRVIERLPGEQ